MAVAGVSRKLSSTSRSDIDFSTIKFVFLDRDGVINRNASDGAYVTSWEEMQLLPGVEQAIAQLNQASRIVIVVTNQRGVALGRLSESQLQSIHEKLTSHLGSFGARIDAIYYCPHNVEQCNCRKPKTGLFDRAFHDFPGATGENSVVIGDSDSDIVAGESLGMKTILIRGLANSTEALRVQPSASGSSLLEVVEKYLN